MSTMNYYSFLAFVSLFATLSLPSYLYILTYRAPVDDLNQVLDIEHQFLISSNLSEPSFTKCQDESSGITWFNEQFNSKWVYLCGTPYLHTIQNGWSAMKCSMSGHRFQSCTMYNVYLHYIKATGFTQFELRCNSTDNRFANHIFNTSSRHYTTFPLPKQLDEWREMKDNEPNRRNQDITLMDERNMNNRTYVDSFSPNNLYNDYTWYYSNAYGDWCWNFRINDSTFAYSNPWHCISFLTQIFGTKIAPVGVEEIQRKSLYIIGKAGLFWNTSTDDTIVNTLLRPLFTKYIFKTHEHIKAPVHRHLIKQIQIVAHGSQSLVYNFHDNHLKCPTNERQSPLIYAFRQYYLNTVKINETAAILELLSPSSYFDIYYEHSLLTDEHKLINLMDSNVDIILVANRKIKKTLCKKRCLVNNKAWISAMVKRFNGIIFYGNCMHLTFTTQFYLYTKSNMYFGVHGAGFAFTIFMEPKQRRNNKTHFVFEIIPHGKLKKGRTAKHFALYAGLCYANQVVYATDSAIGWSTLVTPSTKDKQLRINVVTVMRRIEHGINACNANRELEEQDVGDLIGNPLNKDIKMEKKRKYELNMNWKFGMQKKREKMMNEISSCISKWQQMKNNVN
eukprot:611611_1